MTVVALGPCLATVAGAAPEVSESPLVGSLGEVGVHDRQTLARIVEQAGIRQAHVHSVERTPERQVRVMLNLALTDFDRAKAMYCDAGDAVLDKFDVKATREENQSVMLQALLAELPRAREMGCLNHVKNDDVVSVDVSADGLSSEQQAALMKAAEAAVADKRVERFLAPPREPGAFHFEFKRDKEVAPKGSPTPSDTAPSSTGSSSVEK